MGRSFDKSYDLHAADAVYHFTCYNELRNENNALLREMSSQASKQYDEEDKKKSALNAVCQYVQDTKTSTQKTVFLLKDLFHMFLAQLTERGYFAEKFSR